MLLQVTLTLVAPLICLFKKGPYHKSDSQSVQFPPHISLSSWFRPVSHVWGFIMWLKPTAHYIWRGLCMYLCNRVIQRSWFHVAMLKIRQWSRGGWGRPSIYTTQRHLCVQKHNRTRVWNSTSTSTAGSAQQLIKNPISVRFTSSTAVQIHYKWIVSRETVLLSQIQQY